MNTLNGVPAEEVSKKDALSYCHEHATKFIAIDGQDQFDGIITILENGVIDPADMGDYGMNDQELRIDV